MDMPLPWAEFISFWSNWTLLSALILGVGATFGIVVSANVKEAHWEKDRLAAAQLIVAAHERIAELNNETARLRDSTRKTALVNLSNRSVMDAVIIAQGLGTRETMSEATRALYIDQKVIKSFAGKQFDAVVTSHDLELAALLGSLKAVLNTMGWIEVERSDIDEIQLSSAGGPALVRIEVDASKDPKLSDAAMALASALNAEGIEAKVYPKADATNVNVIHLLIGPKP